jgi:ERCC4-type nuclease
MLLDNFTGDKPAVVYDTHEARTFVVRYLKKFEDITVVSRPLEIADYLVQGNEGTIAVERKRASDFLSSIRDGRLFTQMEHLVEYDRPKLILEGAIFTSVQGGRCYSIDNIGKAINLKRSHRTQPRTMWSTQFFVHPHAFVSIFEKIQDMGITIVQTGSSYDTADIMHYWATRGDKKEYLSIRHKQKVFSDLDRQLFLVSGLTGISTKRAEALLRHFGTPMRVFHAFLEYPSKKFPVEGIGEKTTDEIKRVLSTNLLDVQPSRLIEYEFKECVRELEEIFHRAERDLMKKTVPELKAIAKEKGLKVGGTKGMLVGRILDTMSMEEKVDVPLFIKKYEALLKMKTEFHQVPGHLQKAYEKFRNR